MDWCGSDGFMGFFYLARLSLACGGVAMNSVEDLAPENLGQAGLVYEHVLVRRG